MDTLGIMQNHFPERLGVAILFVPPKFFQVCWSVVHPFLDARTNAKIRFVDPSTAAGRTELATLLDLSQLDTSLGGTASQPWDFAAFRAWVSGEEREARAAEAAAVAALRQQAAGLPAAQQQAGGGP